MTYEAPSADAISATGEPYTAPDADNVVAESGTIVVTLSTVASSQSEADSALQKTEKASFGVSAESIEALKSLNSKNIGTTSEAANVAVGSVGATAKIGSIIDSTSISSAIETFRESFAEIGSNNIGVSEQTDVLATNIAPSDAFSGATTTTDSQRESGETRTSVSSGSASITGGYLLRTLSAYAPSVGKTSASGSGSSLTGSVAQAEAATDTNGVAGIGAVGAVASALGIAVFSPFGKSDTWLSATSVSEPASGQFGLHSTDVGAEAIIAAAVRLSNSGSEADFSPTAAFLDEQTTASATEPIGPTTEASSETTLQTAIGKEIIEAVVSAELVPITRGVGDGAVPSRVSSSALSVWTTPATTPVFPEVGSATEISSETEYPESRDSFAETKLIGAFKVAPESATVSSLLEAPLEPVTNSPKSRSLPLSIGSTSSESLGTDNSDSALLLVSTDTITTALIERELQTIVSVGFTDADSNAEALSAYSVLSIVDYTSETESQSDPMRAAAVGVNADSNTESLLQLPRSLFVEANSEVRPLVFLKLYGDPIVQPKQDIQPKYSFRRGRVKYKTAAGDSIHYKGTVSTTYHSNSGEIEYGESSSQE